MFYGVCCLICVPSTLLPMNLPVLKNESFVHINKNQERNFIIVDNVYIVHSLFVTMMAKNKIRNLLLQERLNNIILFLKFNKLQFAFPSKNFNYRIQTRAKFLVFSRKNIGITNRIEQCLNTNI